MSGSGEAGGGGGAAIVTDRTISTSSTATTALSLDSLVTAKSSTSAESTVTTAIDINTLLHLDSFPDDVLFAVFKRLDIQNRLNCAKVSHRWNKLLKKWVDIQSIGISEKHFSIKNECIEDSISFKVLDTARINPMVLMFLKKCSHTFNLVIHNAHILKYFATIWSKFQNLELLILPNDTFDELKFKDSATLLHLLSNPKLKSLHILEHVKSFPSKKRIFAPLHVSQMFEKRLQVFHLHGVILGPLAMEKLAEKYCESLQELRIGAVCVHTPDSERYWKALSKFTNLKILELPPSLFSISRPLETKNLADLSNLKNLECLSVFICPYGGTEVGLFLSYLPKSVRKLMVRTYTDELPDNVTAALGQQKIKLIFLPKKSYSFRWPFKHSDGHYQLFLKGFWEPPYFPETELIGITLTPEIIRAQTSNWTCILPELSKFEVSSMQFDAVETAQHKATDMAVTAISAVSASSSTSLPTARERSPIVEHPSADNVVQEVMHDMIEQVGTPTNEANAAAPVPPQTPPAELHTVPSTENPLIRPETSAATNVAPAQELPLSTAQPQDGNSNYALSTPTTTAISSSENVTTAVGIEELQVSATQRSDASSSESFASTSTASTSTTSTSSSTTSGETTTPSSSSVGTGWFV